MSSLLAFSTERSLIFAASWLERHASHAFPDST
jgi:hypothetical protein